eukprot:1194218-Amphidinium_carterae.1
MTALAHDTRIETEMTHLTRGRQILDNRCSLEAISPRQVSGTRLSSRCAGSWCIASSTEDRMACATG